MNTTFDKRPHALETGRGTDPLRLATAVARLAGTDSGTLEHGTAAASPGRTDPSTAAVRRQRAQLPTFAPLLEEVELAGWSSHRRTLSGNFHDWMLVDDRRVLMTVGRTIGTADCGAVDAALVAQAAWTAIRAHARHTCDAGALLSLAASTLWPLPDDQQQAMVALALVDTMGGRVSLAVAGDCLAWRVRAATCEPLCDHQPPLGTSSTFPYLSHEIELRLRERLVLIADNPLLRTERMTTSIEAGFTHLDAETHRRMTAPDALGIVRRPYERAAGADPLAAVSIAVVRRR